MNHYTIAYAVEYTYHAKGEVMRSCDVWTSIWTVILVWCQWSQHRYLLWINKHVMVLKRKACKDLSVVATTKYWSSRSTSAWQNAPRLSWPSRYTPAHFSGVFPESQEIFSSPRLGVESSWFVGLAGRIVNWLHCSWWRCRTFTHVYIYTSLRSQLGAMSDVVSVSTLYDIALSYKHGCPFSAKRMDAWQWNPCGDLGIKLCGWRSRRVLPAEVDRQFEIH